MARSVRFHLLHSRPEAVGHSAPPPDCRFFVVFGLLRFLDVGHYSRTIHNQVRLPAEPGALYRGQLGSYRSGGRIRFGYPLFPGSGEPPIVMLHSRHAAPGKVDIVAENEDSSTKIGFHG